MPPVRCFSAQKNLISIPNVSKKMLLGQSCEAPSIVEFGAGDGSAVINALLKTPFSGVIRGYELSPTACQVAQTHIQKTSPRKPLPHLQPVFF